QRLGRLGVTRLCAREAREREREGDCWSTDPVVHGVSTLDEADYFGPIVFRVPRSIPTPVSWGRGFGGVFAFAVATARTAGGAAARGRARRAPATSLVCPLISGESVVITGSFGASNPLSIDASTVLPGPTSLDPCTADTPAASGSLVCADAVPGPELQAPLVD